MAGQLILSTASYNTPSLPIFRLICRISLQSYAVQTSEASEIYKLSRSALGLVNEVVFQAHLLNLRPLLLRPVAMPLFHL